jgi:hypothetical protein
MKSSPARILEMSAGMGGLVFRDSTHLCSIRLSFPASIPDKQAGDQAAQPIPSVRHPDLPAK